MWRTASTTFPRAGLALRTDHGRLDFTRRASFLHGRSRRKPAGVKFLARRPGFRRAPGEAAIEDNSKFKIQNSKLENPQAETLSLESGIATAVKKRVKRVMWERVGSFA